MGRIAALSRFISRLGEKAIPLYQMMRKTDNFVWSDAANEAFEALKRQLAEPPVLAAPIGKEPLLLYVATNNKAVSVAVMVEWKSRARNIWFSGQFIMSGRCSLSLSKDTHIGKNWFMACSRLAVS